MRDGSTLTGILFIGKAVSQMWMNAGDPTKLMQPTIPEEEEVDDEDMGVAETYADYMPMKRTIRINVHLTFSISTRCSLALNN